MCMFVLNAIDRNIPWTPPHSLPISVDCCINFALKCIINLKQEKFTYIQGPRIIRIHLGYSTSAWFRRNLKYSLNAILFNQCILFTLMQKFALQLNKLTLSEYLLNANSLNSLSQRSHYARTPYRFLLHRYVKFSTIKGYS